MIILAPALGAAQVYYQLFWMKAWGHETAKRTIVLASTHLIKSLDCGPMKRKALESAISTTDTYESKDGRKRFKGNTNLKGTQLLSLHLFKYLLLLEPTVVI